MSANAAQEEYWSTRGLTWIEFQERMDRQLDQFGRAAIDAVAPRAGERILDVGCGCGHTSFQLADTIGEGEVVGLDISDPMLDRARARLAQGEGASEVAIDFVTADAQIAPLGGPYDAVYSRFGVMFFADPVAAFTNLAAAAPGGRLGFVCWQGVQHNPWMTVPNRAAMTKVEFPPRGPNAADPFAFGDPDHVREILTAAGWRNVDIEPHIVEVPLAGGGGLDEVVPFMIDLGPTAAALEGREPQLRADVEAAIADALAPYERDGSIWLPGATWIVTATR